MGDIAKCDAGTALTDLVHEGVSLWLDGVSRRDLVDGSLSRCVAQACVTGAVLSLRELGREVRDGTVYRDQIDLLGRRGATVDEAVRALHAYDARWACDVLQPVFVASGGADGWVCAELDPRFTDDTCAAVAEAQAVAHAVNRPNLLVKVAGTASGTAVVSGCVAAGIGVHAMHVHSVRSYGDVIEAYFDGLERARAAGRPGGASVVSFGAARMEIAVDARLAAAARDAAAGLRGRTALALAQAAYDLYEDRLGGARWRTLRASGARPQRLLWPEAGRPGPEAAAVRRVAELVGWHTVHAVSQSTLDAVARLGRPQGDTLSGEAKTAAVLLADLRQHGIDVERLAVELTEADLRQRVRDRMDLGGALRSRWTRHTRR